MNKKEFKNFELYSRALIGSKDVDPTYSLIKAICEHCSFEKEWFTFVYTSFYNLRSACIVCWEMPSTQYWDKELFRELKKDLRFGHERRGKSRNVDFIISHLEAAKHFIDVVRFDPLFVMESNEDFRFFLESMPNVGGWASFKIAEIFEKSLGYKKLSIPDLGLNGRDLNSNDGPIGGLRWLTGRNIQYDEDWIEHWNKFGEELSKAWGVCIGEVETCFCKWHKMKTGKYFIGHDIQEFVELTTIFNKEEFQNLMFNICNFSEQILKDEQGNLLRVLQKDKKKIFRDTGVIINQDFANLLPKIDAFEIFMSI